jgi:hypothetical protein
MLFLKLAREIIHLSLNSKHQIRNIKEWKVIRDLNGDQTHQGRQVRIFLDDYSILRFELYNYN